MTLPTSAAGAAGSGSVDHASEVTAADGIAGSAPRGSVVPSTLALVRVFLVMLAALLVGYMFAGRGFAHLGLGPIYVGDLVLAAGVVATAYAVVRLRIRPRVSPVLILLLAFMTLGLIRTVPYLGEYRLDALRDATLWGYGLFAIIIVTLVDRETLQRGLRLYGWVVPVFSAWLLVAAPIAAAMAAGVDPLRPGQDVPLVVFKNGDMAVHMIGSLASLIVVAGPWGSAAWFAERTAISYVLARTAFSIVTLSRGALLTVAAGVAGLLVVRARTRNWLPVILGTVLMVLLMLPSFTSSLATCDPNGDPAARLADDRDVSACQLIQNTTSIVSTSEAESLQGTKSFRLAWWTDIVRYTVFGPHFWSGKGFGINLADADGYQVNADHSLRAPHNSHLTTLARMGVPGFVLWGLLQAAFAFGLLRALLAFRRAGDSTMAGAAGWILVYWLAMMVNTSFDPYLEGPQGGIWFWALVGFGMVVIGAAPRRSRT